MKKYHLKDMVKGWFVGGFSPTVIQTEACEVAVKQYKKGEYESKHFHKKATEVTVIVSGCVKMNDVVYQKNDIIVIEKNEQTDFQALEETTTVVVKVPGALDDKYLVSEDC